ncbi:MAG: zinc ABC transporter substrate-binding protein [Pseudomonadota bacterium]
MYTRRTLLATAALTLALAAPVGARADAPIPVVATFSILGDMVARIGGEHIALTTLVGPGGDAHVYQPTPADARAVSEADVLFVNGLDFEGWLDRLVEASDFDGTRVVSTKGMAALPFEEGDDHDDDHAGEAHGGHDDHAGEAKGEHGHSEHGHDEQGHDDHSEHAEGDHHGHDHGAFDPHAWQSLEFAVTYIDNITAALATADPANAATFYQNRAAYVAEIEALDAEIRAIVAALPEDRRTVVTSHDAFGYFEAEYGLAFEAPQGLSTESEPSAADVAAMIDQIREESISAVFVESITDNRLLQQIASETGATIGGTLYSDALSEPDGPAGTYLDMMRHNATTIAAALSSQG